LAEYLHWYLEQPVAKDYFLKNSVTSTIPSLSKSVLDDLPVPLPPLSIQASVVEKLRLLNQQEKILAEMLRKTREFRDAHVWDVITNDLNKIL
jgi:restriction endonuclease S subunit